MISITKHPKIYMYIHIYPSTCVLRLVFDLKEERREWVRKAINFRTQVPFALLTLVTEFASITQGGGLQQAPPLPKVYSSPSLTLTIRLSVNLITLVECLYLWVIFQGCRKSVFGWKATMFNGCMCVIVMEIRVQT